MTDCLTRKSLFLFVVFGHVILYVCVRERESATSKLYSVVADRLKTALSRIAQDCDQWIKPQMASSSSSSPTSLNSSFAQMDVTPASPVNTNFGQGPTTSFGLKVFIFRLTKVTGAKCGFSI